MSVLSDITSSIQHLFIKFQGKGRFEIKYASTFERKTNDLLSVIDYGKILSDYVYEFIT